MTASKGRSIGRVVAFGIPLGVFLSLAACVIDDGPTGLLIVQDQWLETTTGTATCEIPGTATTNRRTAGVLDVTVLDPRGTRYYLYPVVKNILDPFSGLVGSATSGSVEEKSNILMKSFHVKLDVATSTGIAWNAGCSGEYDVPVDSWLLTPGSTVADIVELIRPCNAAPLFQYLQANQSVSSLLVTATVRAKGHLGSTDIESPPFAFPVSVCYGCLQTGYADPTAAQFSFPGVAMCSDLTTNPYTGDPCNPSQDTTILCCALDVDAQGHAANVLCPAVPTGTTTP